MRLVEAVTARPDDVLAADGYIFAAPEKLGCATARTGMRIALIRASSLQFIRKLSGFSRPSKANEIAFNRAVDEVDRIVHELLDALVTNAPPRNREAEAMKARARGRVRSAA